MDPSVASNTLMSSTRHWAQLFSGRPRAGFKPPAIVPNITRWVNRPLVVCCTVAAKRKEVSFAESRLNALTLCLLERLGVRHAVVGVLSALKANDP